MHLVGRVVKHMLHCKANGTLVLPKWTSALCWPSLVSDFGQFQFFATEYIEYVKPNISLYVVLIRKVYLLNLHLMAMVLRLTC